MKCPSCDHEAPASDFGDPLRCPECGIFYEKALHLKLKQELAPRRSEPSEAVLEDAKAVAAAVKQCRKCKSLMDRKATICPTCRTKQQRMIGTFPGLILIGLAACAIVAMFGGVDSGPSYTPPSKPPVSKCEDPTMAFVMSQNFVKQRLKSPATADFPYMSADGVHVKKVADCTYQVIAFVDSQNGFGALIRSRYSATMKSAPDGKTWSARDIVIQ